ncbi:hypothetical protein SteCoe_39038 [Stentor coeruleus]|uniref:Uncharacterized protein n=1 Tax=Stentor coeruleus TaxID=5963 RepID=A0A1R2AL47_9CILI|nr:hypothetical protein SteCoe_39038 [Stentor coeruleus]
MKSLVKFDKQEIRKSLKAYEDFGLLLQGPEKFIRCMDITYDNKYVVTGSEDNCIYIWSLENFQLLKKIEGHKSRVYNCLVTKDLKRLITCSEDKTIKVWEFGSFILLGTMTSEYPFYSISLHPNGKDLYSGGKFGAFTIFDFENYTVKSIEKICLQEIYDLSISKNGQLAFLVSFDHILSVWDCAQGYIKCNKLFTSPLASVTISENSELVAVGSFDSLIRIFKTETIEEVITLKGHSGVISDLSVFKNILISSSSDSTVCTWDFNTFTKLQDYKGHNYCVHCSSITLDGRYLLTTSLDSTFKIWDRQTDKILQDFSAQFGKISFFSTTPNGKYIFTSSNSQILNIWDLEKKKRLLALEKLSGFEVSVGIAYKKYLIVCDSKYFSRVIKINKLIPEILL